MSRVSNPLSELRGWRAVVEAPVEHWIGLRKFAHPSDELRYGVLVYWHLTVTVEKLVEVSIRVIAQTARIGVDTERCIRRHITADATIEHDLRALAAADVLQGARSQVCREMVSLVCRWMAIVAAS